MRANMHRRPLPVLIVSIGFILIGAGGLLRGIVSLLRGAGSNSHELMDIGLVSFSGILALLSGVFMLRRANWARWLCVTWMALHVVLSLFHTPFETVIHSAMLVVLILVLFRPSASSYFRGHAAPEN